MCIVTRVLTSDMAPSVLTNIIQVLIAVPIYFALTTILKVNPLVMYIRKRRMDK